MPSSEESWYSVLLDPDMTDSRRVKKNGRELLVHPKDKHKKQEDITECVYRGPCGNCDKIYVGETERKLGIRLQEHRMEVDSKSKRAFTRSQRTASLSEHSKSALTDHATQENHVINWA